MMCRGFLARKNSTHYGIQKTERRQQERVKTRHNSLKCFQSHTSSYEAPPVIVPWHSNRLLKFLIYQEYQHAHQTHHLCPCPLRHTHGCTLLISWKYPNIIKFPVKINNHKLCFESHEPHFLHSNVLNDLSAPSHYLKAT